MAEEEKFYSTSEFAQLVKRSPATIYSWTHSGKIKPIKDNFSGRNLFTRDHYKLVTGRDLN